MCIRDRLGAHIIKIKLSTDHLMLGEAKKVYEKEKIDIATQAARVKHCVDASFAGRRIIVSVSYTHLDVYKRQVFEQGGVGEDLPTLRLTPAEMAEGFGICLLYTSRCV